MGAFDFCEAEHLETVNESSMLVDIAPSLALSL